MTIGRYYAISDFVQYSTKRYRISQFKLPCDMQRYTILIRIGSTWSEVFINIESDLKSINSWLSDNSLFINFDKSAIILRSLSEITLPTKHDIKIHENDCKTIELCHRSSVIIV